MNLQEAADYIDKNEHARLWCWSTLLAERSCLSYNFTCRALLAEVALSNLNAPMAEHAFVRLQDYAGIQFVKKLNNVQKEALRRAEVAAYFGRFDEAEKLYLENDRR